MLSGFMQVWALVAVLFVGLLGLSATAEPFCLESDEFPLGFYAVNPAAMHLIEAIGGDELFIHTYGMGRGADEESLARDLAYLDRAHQHGLRVMVNLHGSGWVSRPDGMEQVLTIARALKDHPAFGFWYLYDEPDNKGHTPDDILPYYNALKKLTPDVPVAVAHAWSANWRRFAVSQDITMIDIYPVTGRPFPDNPLQHMTTFTEQALALGKPVFPINQCFNWRALAGPDATEYRGSPVADLRTPNPAELRYLAYAGLCQGVRGSFWWSVARGLQTDSVWIRTEFTEAMIELRQFVELIRPAHEPVRLRRAEDQNLYLALWQRPTGTWLVLVNAWPLGQDITRWLEDHLQTGTLTPWGSTRDTEARIENGRLTGVDAGPWEVFIWRVETTEDSAAGEN